jgi:hypothetical protein
VNLKVIGATLQDVIPATARRSLRFSTDQQNAGLLVLSGG